MSIDLSAIANRKPKISNTGNLKEFSVFVPIYNNNGVDSLIFEVRSDKLNNKPGEVCFPGGKIERGESSSSAAVRETCEELFIKPENIEVICELDTVVTPFNLVIYPFLGYLHEYPISFNETEVKEIFSAPLDFFMNNSPLTHYTDVKIIGSADFPYHMIPRGENYRWADGKYSVNLYKFEDKVIWGITARIISNMVNIFKKCDIKK